MDHTEAMQELDGLFRIAQDALGGDWESGDDGAEACELPSGEAGVRYVFARYGTALAADQQTTVVDTIVAGWTARDFTPTAGTDTSGEVEISTVRYPATGRGVDGLYMQFRAGVNGSSIQGQTRCVPGDAGQINEEFHSNP